MFKGNITFEPDKKAIKAAFRQFAKRMRDDTRLAADIKEVNQKIADVVKHYLITTTTRDESATDEDPTHRWSRSISSHILGEAKPTRDGVEGGIGRTSLLDLRDPIFEMNRIISSENVRLWRILEYGAAPHRIDARNVPVLAFYFKRIGRFIRTPYVNHPGSIGRAYFVSSLKEGWSIYKDGVKKALNKMFERLQ